LLRNRDKSDLWVIGNQPYDPPIDETPPPLEPGAIEALVRFLPLLESPEFSAGEWRGGKADEAGVIQMPWFELSADARAFIAELGRYGWVYVFDWRAWEDEAKRLIDAGGVEVADLDNIRRLYTTLVRSDRFTEGQLAWAFESGLIVRILRRLRELDAG
jgi:uncharacterized protein DUF6508